MMAKREQSNTKCKTCGANLAGHVRWIQQGKKPAHPFELKR